LISQLNSVEDDYSINHKIGDEDFHLRILDTSGSENYFETMYTKVIIRNNQLKEKWLKDTDGFMLVYSIDQKHTFEMLEVYRNKILSYFRDDRVPMIIVGTKGFSLFFSSPILLADRQTARQVSIEEASRWASKYGYPIIECSAKTGENVEQAFNLLIRKVDDNRERVRSLIYFDSFLRESSCNSLISGKRNRLPSLLPAGGAIT
jgi:GTPase SAR1 family protein